MTLVSATIGLDIGGTKISGGVIDGNGVILAQGRRDTPALDPAAIIHEAASLTRELSSQHKIDAVGVACAAFIDRSGSTVYFSPNLAWRDEPLKARLESALELPVTIENDANAAAWGEFRFGAAADAGNMVMVTVGTGIGGGIVVDGVLMHGAFGVAAELGHMRVVPGGVRCGCGNRGCWEMYASGTALVREAQELVVSGSPLAARLGELCGGDPATLRGPDVTRAAAEGDPAAIELLGDRGGPGLGGSHSRP
jgi:glucokinase